MTTTKAGLSRQAMTNKKIPEGIPGQRIHIIDAFRGFALAGVVLVHMVEQYLAAAPTEALRAVMIQDSADGLIEFLLMILVRGKFFAMFSFLFGLSFFIQMDRAANRGVNYHGRFLWRVTLLLLIGYAHSLFYRGDILTIYAMLAFLLVPFYGASNKVVLWVAALLLLGAGRFVVFAFASGETIIPYGAGLPELPHNIAYLDAVLSGSLADVFAANAVFGHLAILEFQLNYSGRFYLTFGFFLLGLWVGRIRLFEKLDEWHASIRRALKYGIILTVVFLVSTFLLFGVATGGSGEVVKFDTWLLMLALSSLDLFNLSFAAVMLCAFVLIYSGNTGERVLGKLAPYGRMALSNYVMQTLIGTFLLFNFGFGLLGELSNTQALGIAVVLIVTQIWLSNVWLKWFRYGPIEWLWRSGTKWSWQPLARQASRQHPDSLHKGSSQQ
jgi:uncharacterized protein